MEASKNPYDHLLTSLEIDGKQYSYYDFGKLNDPRIDSLPIAIKVLLECALRNCDDFNVTKEDIENIINWKVTSTACVTIILARQKSPSSPRGSFFKTSPESPSSSILQL
jgi:aconitate hydratase